MRILTLLVISLLCTYQPSSGQKSPADSESNAVLLREVFDKVKQYSVFRKQLNWKELTEKLFADQSGRLTAPEFKEKVRLLFTTIGDNHGGLVYQGERLGMDRSWIKTLRLPPHQPEKVELTTVMLEDGYGYMLLPPEARYDRETCQRYQDALCSLGALKGLIIDLRLHEGGSVYPLFSGLNQVYGAKTFGYNMGLDGTVYKKWTVQDGSFGRNLIRNRCALMKGMKIVVLTSQITASAGEMMAVGLKGRPKTLFIGEPTAGFTTMTMAFKLGEHTLSIAASIIADRNGVIYRDKVYPDLTMVDGDNFQNLSADTKVVAALNWMKGN